MRPKDAAINHAVSVDRPAGRRAPGKQRQRIRQDTQSFSSGVPGAGQGQTFNVQGLGDRDLQLHPSRQGFPVHLHYG